VSCRRKRKILGVARTYRDHVGPRDGRSHPRGLQAVIPKNGAALSIELVIAFAAGIGAAVGFIEGRKSREQDKADGIERDQYYKISTLISWPIIWGGGFAIPPFLLALALWDTLTK